MKLFRRTFRLSFVFDGCKQANRRTPRHYALPFSNFSNVTSWNIIAMRVIVFSSVNGVHTFYIQKNIMSNNILSIGQATFVPLSVYGPYIQVRWPSFERSSQFNNFLNLKGDGKVSVVVLGFRLVWLAIWHLQHEVVVPAFCATSQTQAQLHTHTLKHFYYSNVL